MAFENQATETSLLLMSRGLVGSTPVVGAQAGAAAAISATLAGTAGTRTYLSGFTVTGAGATAASVIEVQVTGLGTTMLYKVVVPAGATVAVTPLHIDYSRALAASADNTSIVVSVPSFGAGNTAAAVTAVGFRI